MNTQGRSENIKKEEVKKRRSHQIFVAVLLITLAVTVSGCVYLVIGGIGAVGGYVASPDTVEGFYDYPKSEIWEAAMDIIPVMGIIEESDAAAGIIIAKVSRSKVTFTVTEFGGKSSEVSVKARKGLLPKISVAQDVFIKIMSRVQN